MTIPDYQTIMLPLLKHLSDKKERSTQETLDALAEEFQLTDNEREELLPSGRQPIFTNRVAWAKVYLKKAGLIEAPKRGYYKISENGLEVLRNNPTNLNNSFLTQFPKFAEFVTLRKSWSRNNSTEQEFERESDIRTPEEYLEYGYARVREKLSTEILNRVKECSPSFFENLVLDLLLKMGYGGSRWDDAKAVGKSGDGGIDGIIKEDKLGLETIYIQAKRWEGVVGRPEIQKFAGALQGHRSKKGIFITTSDFTKEANDYVRMIDTRIVLINGTQLANLMFDYDIGVTKIASYEIKRIDSDYFSEE